MTEVKNEDNTVVFSTATLVPVSVAINEQFDRIAGIQAPIVVAMVLKARYGEHAKEFLDLVDLLLPQVTFEKAKENV